MLPELYVKKIVRTETLKLSILASLIIIGGIILAIFIPSTEALNWIDFIFYASIGFLVIVYQCFSFYFKTRKVKQALTMDRHQELDEDIPVTKTDVIGKQENKGQVLVSKEAASFCPRCGGSYTKTHRFCPNCGYCGIIKKLK